MGSDISPLGLLLSLRLNSEQLIYVISGLSLTCRSNSEKLARFKITADTLMTFARDFFCTKEKHRHTTKLFKVKSGFFYPWYSKTCLSFLLREHRTILDNKNLNIRY